MGRGSSFSLCRVFCLDSPSGESRRNVDLFFAFSLYSNSWLDLLAIQASPCEFQAFFGVFPVPGS